MDDAVCRPSRDACGWRIVVMKNLAVLRERLAVWLKWMEQWLVETVVERLEIGEYGEKQGMAEGCRICTGASCRYQGFCAQIGTRESDSVGWEREARWSSPPEGHRVVEEALHLLRERMAVQPYPLQNARFAAAMAYIIA
jgi:hypothetical protein